MKRIILSIVAIIMGAFIAFAPFSNPVFADPPQSGKSINDLLIEAKKAKEQCKNSSNCTTYDKIVQQLSQKDSNTLKNTKTAYEKQRKEDIEKCKNHIKNS